VAAPPTPALLPIDRKHFSRLDIHKKVMAKLQLGTAERCLLLWCASCMS
jgi:hypothetical protein